MRFRALLNNRDIMIYVNDDYIDSAFFSQCFQIFSAHPQLKDCAGKRVAVCLQNPAQLLALCLYLKRYGGSFYPILATTPRLAAKRLADKANCHIVIFDIEQAGLTLKREDKDQQAVLVQTSSGTTGEPKVITRSWSSIDEEIESYVATFTAPQSMTPLIACPITHSYGLICGVLVALKRDLVPVIITNINPKYLLRKCLENSEHLLYSSPSLLHSLVQLYPKQEQLHAVMTSGTVLPQAWFEAIKVRSQYLFQQYGCSEAGCIAVCENPDYANQMGFPLPHLRVSAGSDVTSPQEIIVSKNKLDINTKDLGFFDVQGQLCFVSRSDDMINVSGLNVYPQDVENVVMELAEITDAVVFKRADELSGERVCLQFVADTMIEPSRIRQWCGTRLANHQLPVDIEQREIIEKAANGKINRKALSQSSVSIAAIG